MKQGQFIKKVISIPLYLIVLYYILPFRPGQLYYVAHHSSANILNEIKNQKDELNRDVSAANKQQALSNNSFPKKDRVRFFFKTDFALPAPPSDKFAFITSNEIRTFLFSFYQPPLVIFALDRGPPLA